MTLEFFFENDDDKRSYNFRNLVKHINKYLEEHQNLELNKVEHIDPEGHNVYALVSFKEKETKIVALEGIVQNLTTKAEEKIEDLERSLSLVKESLFGKNIVNEDGCTSEQSTKNITEDNLPPKDVQDKDMSSLEFYGEME